MAGRKHDTSRVNTFPRSQDDVNALLCNIMRSHSNSIPKETAFKANEGESKMHTAWGVAVTGAMIFNGISGEGVDPYYPAKYGRVTDLQKATERVDRCLSHPAGRSGMLHYHTVSTWAANASLASSAAPPGRGGRSGGAALDARLALAAQVLTV